MHFLTHDECWGWFRERVKDVEASSAPRSHPVMPLSGFLERRHKLPVDSGKKVVLARLATNNLFGSEKAGLVWLQNWAVWPSSGHLPILHRYRQALRETRDVETVPGFTFSIEAVEDATSFLILSLEFYWDCLAIADSGDSGFFVSHDEYYSFFSRDSALVDSFDLKVNRLSLLEAEPRGSVR